jgi:hypothetical protein
LTGLEFSNKPQAVHLNPHMRFLMPGHTMTIEVNIVKMTDEAALVKGVARVEDTIVMRGKLSFARMMV